MTDREVIRNVLERNGGAVRILNSELERAPGSKRLFLFKDKSSSGGSGGSSSSGSSNHHRIIPAKQHTNTLAAEPLSDQLTVSAKEKRLIAALRLAPEFDALVVQDALLRCEWNIRASVEHLRREALKRKLSPTQPLRNGHKTKKPKKDNYDSDTDGRPNEKVFDSDEDSNHEISTHVSKSRVGVFEFMSNATPGELLAIKSCSSKKVDAIVELRPFRNWTDLVERIKESRHLSSELLNHCQDLLNRRTNLALIMKKCNKLVENLEKAVASGGGVVQQPANLNPNYKLAEYQMVGLNWLAVMHQENMNGILADEMGLGKTIQVIAFLAYLKASGFVKHAHLVVVPSSTLDNWGQEMAKWCPELVVAKYYGSIEERKAIRIQWARGGLTGIDVILTTYHTVVSTPEERKMFRVTPMHYVIFDEAHMLKNMTSQRYEHLVRINAANRILLTGTPLQNNLLELMSLLCFVMPSLFSGSTDDIKSLFQKNKGPKTENGEETPSFEQSQIAQAKRIMKPFLLRRLKKDVLSDLPKKSYEIVKIEMPQSQRDKYTELVQCYSSESGIVKATTELSGMSMMMDMRKLANHPLLLRYYYSDEKVHQIAKKLAKDSTYKKTNADHIFDDLAILSDFQLHELTEKHKSISKMGLPSKLILESGKFAVLDKMLPKLQKGGHRVLIFSQFTMMLDILEQYLVIRDYGYMRLDGNTNVNERQELIDLYNNDEDYFIFLLSTRAGGLGINLTAADTVIIHDIDFNPYNDKQAEDRCHRMGQTRPVTIYRMLTDRTIEEGMQMVAQEKLNLEREVTTDKDEVVEEHKCVVRLLTMALGMDPNRAESLISSATQSASAVAVVTTAGAATAGATTSAPAAKSATDTVNKEDDD